jgi:hypothetical protein
MTRFEEVAETQHVDEADDAGFVSLAWNACSDLRRMPFTRPPPTDGRSLDRTQGFGDGLNPFAFFDIP